MLILSDKSFLAKKRLHIWKKIGEGSFSKVYLTTIGKSVNGRVPMFATKIINKKHVSAKFIDKFLPRELEVLLKLKHPFIIQVHSVFQHKDNIYINMEYARNGDLYAMLRKKTLTEPQIRSLCVQILLAVKYIHSAGVAHRDIKCENILLTSSYNVRLADFGFARFVGHGEAAVAETACGTLSYSSPELLYGVKPYNAAASDVWAVGVVLFMMANNEAPFRIDDKKELYRRQITKDYEFRKVLNRSESLEQLIAQFLEPDVSLRVTVKNALLNSWVRKDHIETRILLQRGNAVNVEQNDTFHNPSINTIALKSSSFHYQVSNYINSKSSFNDEFSVYQEYKDMIYD